MGKLEPFPSFKMYFICSSEDVTTIVFSLISNSLFTFYSSRSNINRSSVIYRYGIFVAWKCLVISVYDGFVDFCWFKHSCAHTALHLSCRPIIFYLFSSNLTFSSLQQRAIYKFCWFIFYSVNNSTRIQPHPSQMGAVLNSQWIGSNETKMI